MTVYHQDAIQKGHNFRFAYDDPLKVLHIKTLTSPGYYLLELRRHFQYSSCLHLKVQFSERINDTISNLTLQWNYRTPLRLVTSQCKDSCFVTIAVHLDSSEKCLNVLQKQDIIPFLILFRHRSSAGHGEKNHPRLLSFQSSELVFL